MDNFLHELIDIAKLPFEEISKDFKIIMLGSKILHVTNFIKILDYSKESIVLKISKDFLIIKGSDLNILQIDKKELIIKGTINSISVGDNNDKKDK